MKTYIKGKEPLLLIKKAIDIFAEGEATHEHYSLVLHSMGFQGFKRWHRYNSYKDRGERIKIQHYIIDMQGDIIEPLWNFIVTTPRTLEEYLNLYLDWETKVITEIACIKNELIKMGYNCEAELIGEGLKDVRKEIEKIRRWQQDFSSVDYNMMYIKLKDKELHDKIKKLEGE